MPVSKFLNEQIKFNEKVKQCVLLRKKKIKLLKELKKCVYSKNGKKSICIIMTLLKKSKVLTLWKKKTAKQTFYSLPIRLIKLLIIK